MQKTREGYREIEHTADWELEVWAPDFISLLEQAARGMYFLAGVRLAKHPRISRSLRIRAGDPESTLVSFLSELVYMEESENIGFDTYQLVLKKDKLHCDLNGSLISSIDKEIKAVTYHKLAVIQTERGLQVNIVFDV